MLKESPRITRLDLEKQFTLMDLDKAADQLDVNLGRDVDLQSQYDYVEDLNNEIDHLPEFSFGDKSSSYHSSDSSVYYWVNVN